MRSAVKKSARAHVSRRPNAAPLVASGDGTLAALRDTLTALRAETKLKSGHARPRELALCWNAVFRDLEEIETAFCRQEELAQTLASAAHDVVVSRRVVGLARTAERLRHVVLGVNFTSAATERTELSAATRPPVS